MSEHLWSAPQKLPLEVRLSTSIQVFGSPVKTHFYALVLVPNLFFHVLLLAFLQVSVGWYSWGRPILLVFIHSFCFVLVLFCTLVSSQAVFKCAVLNKWYGMMRFGRKNWLQLDCLQIWNRSLSQQAAREIRIICLVRLKSDF